MKCSELMSTPAFVLVSFMLIGATQAQADSTTLRLVTTTTTDNSGLISYMLPAFEATSGYKVKVIATGSGRALKHLANGDVDIALTHAPQLESELVSNGQAINHRPVMYNDFILVGPARDPARASASSGIANAFNAIATSECLFLSRGDESGTHLRELFLWKSAGVEARGDWYQQAGQGMGRTLQIADELDAYTLVDRGTWLAFSDKLTLRLIYQGSDRLFNRYSVLSANSALFPETNRLGAEALTEWITSEPAKRLIRAFSINGRQLFIPLL